MRHCGFIPISSAFWKYLGVPLEVEASSGASPRPNPGYFPSGCWVEWAPLCHILCPHPSRNPGSQPAQGHSFLGRLWPAGETLAAAVPSLAAPSCLRGLAGPSLNTGGQAAGWSRPMWWGISLPSADLHILSLSSHGFQGALGPCDLERWVGLWVHLQRLLACTLPTWPSVGLASQRLARK